MSAALQSPTYAVDTEHLEYVKGAAAAARSRISISELISRIRQYHAKFQGADP